MSTSGWVDIHTHAIAPALPDLSARFPWDRWPSVERLDAEKARILIGGRPYRVIDDRCWSPARRVSDMDAEGVAVQVLSPTPITLCHDAPPSGAAVLAAAQNNFLGEMIDVRPDRFRALGAVAMQDPDAAIAELERCVRQLGFLGVEVGTRIGGRELGDAAFDGFFAAAAELDALVFVHPVDDVLDSRLVDLGIAFGAGMPSETGVSAAGLLVGGALGRRPRVRLCLAHAGGTLPWLLPRLDKGERIKDPGIPPERLPSAMARSLYCDSLTYDAGSLDLAVQRFGIDHVLLGTDYPFTAKEEPGGAVLDRAGHRARACTVGRGNAEREGLTARGVHSPLRS